MLDYPDFIQKFNWNHTQLLHESPEKNMKIYIGRQINAPEDEVVIIQISRTFSFSGDFMGKDQSLLKEIRRSLSECHSMLIGPGTHPAKVVKGMTFRFVQEKQGATDYKLEAYFCFEKLLNFKLENFFEEKNLQGREIILQDNRDQKMSELTQTVPEETKERNRQIADSQGHPPNLDSNSSKYWVIECCTDFLFVSKGV